MEANAKATGRQRPDEVSAAASGDAANSRSSANAAAKVLSNNLPSRLPRAPVSTIAKKPRLNSSVGTGAGPPVATGQSASFRHISTSTKPGTTRTQPVASRPTTSRIPVQPARQPVTKAPVAAKPSAIAKPPVAAKPAATSKPPVAAKPLIAARLPVTAKPVVAAKPRINTRQGLTTLPEQSRSKRTYPIPNTAAAASASAVHTDKGPETRVRDLGMDKLQQEYESLQQKLAQLKRDSNRDAGSRGLLCTPRSSQRPTPAQDRVPSTSLPSSSILTAPAPTPVIGVAAAAAPASISNVHGHISGSYGSSSTSAAAMLGAAAAICPSGLSFSAASAAAGSSQATDGLPNSEGLDVQQLLQFSSMHPGSIFAQLGEATFADPDLVASMQHVLTAQLQRTKDGATAQSRISELAGLVVALRRSLKDLVGRAAGFVQEGIKLEQQLQASSSGNVTAASELTIKRLEAEAALARKAAAQIEATYRNERAAWVTSLDAEKFQVARLARDLEGMVEQRDRAREEATRAEQARIQLEADCKELRKAASQQLRDAHMTQGEVERTLREEQRAAEKRQLELKGENHSLQTKLDAALQQLQDTSSQYHSLQQVHQALEASLAGKQTAEASLLKQLSEAHSNLQQLQQQLAASKQQQTALQQDLDSTRDQLMLLQTDVRLKTSRLEAATQQIDAEAAEHTAEREALRGQLQQLQKDKEELAAAFAAAQGELQEAQEAEAAATAKQGLLDADVQRLRQQQEQAAADKLQLQQQLQQLQQAEAQLQATVRELQEALSGAETSLADSKAAAAAQASRLAHLEGEFEALQEVMGEGEHRDVVTRLLSKISSLQASAASAEATRRALHNQMVELRGNIRVFCRVRPHPTPAVRCLPGGTSLSLAVDGKEHMFSFDRVFGPSNTQAQVFSEVSELVQSALDGYHVCLFSYGQTGAGKTHTMQGSVNPPEQRGIIPRAVEQILGAVAQLEEQDWQYKLEASFIEVYNNNLRDLLAEGAGQRPDAGRISDANAIKHDAAGGHTLVAGACRAPVPNADTAAELVARAAAARACEATAMNAVSSRSHVVFMLYIQGTHVLSGSRLHGCLCLVDLAGSERLDRSLAEDLRKKEACSINQSLSALGDVFAALSSKSGHVPYRNSKLTYLLQPCLGGHGKTLMLVNINPEPASAGESLCSLKFAAKVNGCETAAKGGARRNMTVGQENQEGGAGSSSVAGLGKRAAAGTSVTAPAKRSKINPLSAVQ